MSDCRPYLPAGAGFAAGIVVGMIVGVPDAAALAAALREIEEYIDEGGLDDPGNLGSAVVFALIETSALAQAEPALADLLADGGPLTPVQQHPDDTEDVAANGSVDLERYLATTRWPATVAGCAVVRNILIVPPTDGSPELIGTEVAADADPKPTAPDGRPAQLFVGALRSGATRAFLRVLGETELRTTEGAADALIDAIRSTLTDVDDS